MQLVACKSAVIACIEVQVRRQHVYIQPFRVVKHSVIVVLCRVRFLMIRAAE